ncbi:hypothetical protein ACIOD2_46485 [Amycolatopsis sp. NPDC088138]|uniref:beta family protein n=1 Tax=Amycolatopsis sp. NPDC088138 TaxID=3363938 RepID=UPI0037FBF8BE
MVAPASSPTTAAYVAVLKAKQGELLAVQSTPPDSFIPLLEIADPGKAAGLGRAWPHSAHVAWLQPVNLDGLAGNDWAVLVRTMFDELRATGAIVVPVVTLDEASELHLAIRDTVRADGRGLVVRVDCADALEEPPADLLVNVDATLTACGVQPADCDLVLDAGLVDGAAAVQAGAAGAALDALPHMPAWRNVVVTFSAFPANVSTHVQPSSVVSIPRIDAAAFNHLATRWTQRSLIFGDYAVGVPTYADVKWSPIPNIRYAVQDKWIVHRAMTKRNPSPQYIQLARDVSNASYFSGPAFSPGDSYIYDVANGADGPGNAGSYLKAAMSRHFHVVLDSLANRGAP